MMNKSVQYAIGIGIIILGIAGLFLPILQGVLLIALGIFVIRGGNVKKTWKIIRKRFKKGYKKNRKN